MLSWSTVRRRDGGGAPRVLALESRHGATPLVLGQPAVSLVRRIDAERHHGGVPLLLLRSTDLLLLGLWSPRPLSVTMVAHYSSSHA